MKTLAKWSVREYHELIEKGFLNHKKVELLNGELIEMAPESPQHSYAAEGGRNYLAQLLGNQAIVREAHPVTLSNSEPEPDIAIVKPPRANYSDRHPFVVDIFWLVEVSNATLTYDLGDKKDIYSQEGIGEYWVLDLKNRQLHIFKNLVDGQYLDGQVFGDGVVSPQAFPDVKVSVTKLLG